MTAVQFPPLLTSSSSVVNPSGAVTFDSSTGVFLFEDEAALAFTLTLDPAGLCTFQAAATCTGVVAKGATPAAGAGKPLTLSGTDGFTGAAGGVLNLRGGTAGTPGGAGANALAGAIVCDTGATNTSGDAAKISIKVGDPASSSEIFAIQRRSVSYATMIGTGQTMFGSAAAAVYVGCDLLNQQNPSTLWNPNDGSITQTSNWVEFGGAITSLWNANTQAASQTLNFSTGCFQRIGTAVATQLTIDIAVNAPTNPRQGFLCVRIVSDGTHKPTWNGAFLFGAAASGNDDRFAGAVPAAGVVVTHWFLYTGTAWECFRSSLI